MTILNRNFFNRPTLTVARDLLGQRLVRDMDGERLSGMIVETEAYIGQEDSASHASKGRTARTGVMFGPPGHTYVYLIYGMYHMLNLVTEAVDFPAAILIRAIEPVEGIERMRQHRHQNRTVSLANGPGKLCQALAIDRTLNRWDVTQGQNLWLERGEVVAEEAIATGPRIGIDYARPKDRTAPWRFWHRHHQFVSK